MITRLEKQSSPAYHWLFSLGVGIALVISYSEIRAVFNTPQSWEKLFSTAGILTAALYLLVLLVGLFYLCIDRAQTVYPWMPLVRWALIASSLVIASWIFLFSPWQTILGHPWIKKNRQG